MTAKIYVDATMLYRWKHLDPVGIVRTERMTAAHLRFASGLGRAEYVMWDGGYRLASGHEVDALDLLLSVDRPKVSDVSAGSEPGSGSVVVSGGSRGVLPAVRRVGLRGVSRVPGHLRPFAEQAMWSVATLAVESGRYVRRRRAVGEPVSSSGPVRHSVDLSGADLVVLGLGWEYIDHEAMYRLRMERGVRIHMPAFDLIPVRMPQLNPGQSHLMHRFYAEMAHYASSITAISETTARAVREFYEEEGLPVPSIVANTLPAFDPPDVVWRPFQRRHRFEGEPFVLSVSTIEIRKNHVLLAKLWAECIREGHDLPRLVLVGRVGWDVNELMQWAYHAPELNDRFTILTDVDDGQLTELYRDALFTVFPSRIEGWGLPITESLAAGKVCVHADDPAQYEASQSLMPSYHPDDFLGWKAEILRLCNDSNHLASLEQRIADQFVRRTTEQYCRDFDEILARHREPSS